MSTMREIKKSELRPAFVYLNKQQGKSYKSIAEFFGVNRHTVSDAINHFEETGRNNNRPGSGRKRTATDRDNQEAVANAIAQNPSTKVNSARKLARKQKFIRGYQRNFLKRKNSKGVPQKI
jgi:transposase